VIDDDAKTQLHEELRWARDALIWKIDGLGEYDIRRPLTPTGTNLLGLIKHAATWEARYFGEVFSRPFPDLPRWQDADDSDLWVAATETRAHVLDFYSHANDHADATIKELTIDASGHVVWWPQPEVTLFAVMVHVLNDTTRHTGHADILRESLDGRTGVAPGHARPIDTEARATRHQQIEAAAKTASTLHEQPAADH
jgi:hypothetical protein